MKKITNIILIILLFFTQNIFCEILKNYEGKITIKKNKFLKIKMKLYNDKKYFYGFYFYEKVKKNILVGGNYDLNNKNIAIINEYDSNGYNIGKFKLKIENNLLSGNWESPDRKKSYPVELIKINDEIILNKIDTNFSGSWNYYTDDFSFHIEITQKDNKITGYHSGMLNDASRIDHSLASKDSKPSIAGNIKDNIAKIKWESHYSEAKGNGIIVCNGKSILWIITDYTTEGEMYLLHYGVMYKI